MYSRRLKENIKWQLECNKPVWNKTVRTCFLFFKQMLSKNVFETICAIVCKRLHCIVQKEEVYIFPLNFQKALSLDYFHWKSMPTCSLCNKFITPLLRLLVQKLLNCFHNILDPSARYFYYGWPLQIYFKGHLVHAEVEN